jgi:hypothetical protein
LLIQSALSRICSAGRNVTSASAVPSRIGIFYHCAASCPLSTSCLAHCTTGRERPHVACCVPLAAVRMFPLAGCMLVADVVAGGLHVVRSAHGPQQFCVSTGAASQPAWYPALYGTLSHIPAGMVSQPAWCPRGMLSIRGTTDFLSPNSRALSLMVVSNAAGLCFSHCIPSAIVSQPAWYPSQHGIPWRHCRQCP